MSGIAGAVGRFDEPRALAARLAGTLVYREEATDLWWAPGVALCRVHHESSNTAPQPSVSGDGLRRLVFWGDLFNDDRLRQTLSRPTLRQDDAELVLALIDEHGINIVEKFDGSFAFAMHDQSTGELILANDRFSSRPLYYAALPAGGIAFGSQVRTVLHAPGVERRLDERAVRELFHYQRVHRTRTLIRSVAMVPPATILRASRRDTQLNLKSWFQMDYRPEHRSVSYWADAMADRFQRSTKNALRGSKRAGLLLSGGLDSRMIVAASDTPIVCLHFNDSRNREFETASRVAAARGFEFRYLKRPDSHYAAMYDQALDVSDGLYGFHHSHHIGLLPQGESDVMLHGYVPELFFRGTNLPHVDRTLFGRKFWTNDFESLQPLDPSLTRDNIAVQIRARLKYSLNRKQLHRFFCDRWANDFESQMLESAEELVADARPHSDDPFDWFIWADTRYQCKYPSFLFEVALRPFHTERSVVLQNEILDLHLHMPVRMRSNSHVWCLAVQRLNEKVAGVPNANTGRSIFPGPSDLAREVGARVMRRLAMPHNPADEVPPERPWHSNGSWPSFGKMITHEAELRRTLTAVISDPEAIDPEIFDVKKIQGALAEHVSGTADHNHFLMMVLTFGGWHRKYGPPGRGLATQSAHESALPRVRRVNVAHQTE